MFFGGRVDVVEFDVFSAGTQFAHCLVAHLLVKDAALAKLCVRVVLRRLYFVSACDAHLASNLVEHLHFGIVLKLLYRIIKPFFAFALDSLPAGRNACTSCRAPLCEHETFAHTNIIYLCPLPTALKKNLRRFERPSPPTGAGGRPGRPHQTRWIEDSLPGCDSDVARAVHDESPLAFCRLCTPTVDTPLAKSREQRTERTGSTRDDVSSHAGVDWWGCTGTRVPPVEERPSAGGGTRRRTWVCLFF